MRRISVVIPVRALTVHSEGSFFCQTGTVQTKKSGDVETPPSYLIMRKNSYSREACNYFLIFTSNSDQAAISNRMAEPP